MKCLAVLLLSTLSLFAQFERTAPFQALLFGPTDPPEQTDMQLWVDASDFAYANGTTFTNWTDKSGKTHNFTNTIANAPFFTNNVVNGKPAVRFVGGSTSSLKTSSGFMSSFRTGQVFAVLRSMSSPGAAGKTALWQWSPIDNVGGTAHPFTDSQIVEGFGEKGSRVFGTTNLGLYATNWHIWEVQVQTNFCNIFYDGNLLAGNDVVACSFTNGLFLGASGLSSGDTWDGEMAEVRVYDKLVTTASRAQTYATLGAKYNIAYTNLTQVYTPTNFNGLLGWWTARGLGSNDGDSVMVLPDLSGHSLTFTNPVSANAPVYKAAIFNGQPVLRFNGTSQFMQQNASMFLTNWCTIVVIHQPNAATRVVLADHSAGNQYRVNETGSGPNAYLFYDGSTSLTRAFGGSGTALKMSAVTRNFAKNVVTFYDNATNSATTGFNTTLAFSRLGKVTTDTSVIYSGDIAELLVYTNELPLDALSKLYYTYYRGLYGLP